MRYAKLLRAVASSATLLVALLAFPGALVAQPWRGTSGIEVEVTQKGKPVAGAAVVLLFLDADPKVGPGELATSGNGIASAAGLAEGKWRIEVKYQGKSPYSAVVQVTAGGRAEVVAGPVRDAAAPPLSVRFLKPRPGTAAPGGFASGGVAPGSVAPGAPPEPSPARAAPAPAPATTPVPAPATPKVTPPPAAAPAHPPASATPPAATPPVTTPPASAPPVTAPSAVAPPVAAPPVAAPPVTAPKPPPSAAPPAAQPPASAPVPTTPTPAPPVTKPVSPPPAAPTPAVPVPAPTTAAPAPPTPMPSAPPVRPSTAPAPAPPTPVPAPAAPAPATSAPATSVPAAPAPASAPPAPPAAQPSMVATIARSAQDGSCAECKPGESAITVQAAAAPVPGTAGSGAASCQAEADTGKALGLLTGSAPPEAARHLGPLLDPASGGLAAAYGPAAAAAVQPLLAPYLSPGSPCQLLALSLPAGTRYTGYAYEASDSASGGACVAAAECEVGKAHWAGHPVVTKNALGTFVYGTFFNTSPDRERRARLTVYFATGPAPAKK